MRVLVVDDEAEVRSVVERALLAEGHAVATAASLAAARRLLESGADVVVLDLRMPDGQGLDLCRELRASGSTVPILVLTAHGAVAQRVAGLDAGADDFLAKPFAVAELRARVRALGRRGALMRGLVYRSGQLLLDFGGRRATRGNQEIPITAKEWVILEVLARRPGYTVSRAELLESVWGDASETAGATLEVLISRLRRKLDPKLIRTLRGEGYSLAESDRSGA